METLRSIGVVVIMTLACGIVGSIIIAILFFFWLLVVFICALKMQRPPTIKEFLNL
jgi:hypothetical protein